MLSLNEYQRQAMRTNGVTEGITLDLQQATLLNAVLGLCGESGECADLLKKVFFHKHKFDEAKFSKEIGDVQWYVAQAAFALERLLEEIGVENIDKLRARYPDGFSAERSINRDG